MLAAHLAVKDGLLPGVLRKRHGELAGRIEIAEQELGERRAALHAGVEAFDDRGGVIRGRRQRQRLAVHERQHDGATERHHRVDERALTALQLQGRGAVALADER